MPLSQRAGSWCRCATSNGPPPAALQAFTSCARFDQNNGEAWNNVAVLWLQLERPREAFTALGEAVRYKRDSWQTWENYAQAALQTGKLAHAARGLTQARGGTVG